ncbi:hypothetical protein RCL1_001341 [Eukaryota sp. TZLM3-RCL]
MSKRRHGGDRHHKRANTSSCPSCPYSIDAPQSLSDHVLPIKAKGRQPNVLELQSSRIISTDSQYRPSFRHCSSKHLPLPKLSSSQISRLELLSSTDDSDTPKTSSSSSFLSLYDAFHQYLCNLLFGPSTFEFARPLASLSTLTDLIYHHTSSILHGNGVGIALVAKSSGFGRKEVVAEVARRILQKSSPDRFKFLFVDAAVAGGYAKICKTLAMQAKVPKLERMTCYQVLSLLNQLTFSETIIFVDNCDVLLDGDADHLLYLLVNLYSLSNKVPVAVFLSSNRYDFVEKLEVRVRSRLHYVIRMPTPTFDEIYDCFFDRIEGSLSTFNQFLTENSISVESGKKEIVKFIDGHNKSVVELRKDENFTVIFRTIYSYSNIPAEIFHTLGRSIAPKPNFSQNFSNLLSKFSFDFFADFIKKSNYLSIETLCLILAYCKYGSDSSDQSFTINQITSYRSKRREIGSISVGSIDISHAFKSFLQVGLINCVSRTKHLISEDICFKLGVPKFKLECYLRQSRHFDCLKAILIGS